VHTFCTHDADPPAQNAAQIASNNQSFNRDQRRARGVALENYILGHATWWKIFFVKTAEPDSRRSALSQSGTDRRFTIWPEIVRDHGARSEDADQNANRDKGNSLDGSPELRQCSHRDHSACRTRFVRVQAFGFSDRQCVCPALLKKSDRETLCLLRE